MKESYGSALNEKTLKFLVKCIDIAQKTESIHPDKEEMDREYDEYEFKG